MLSVLIYLFYCKWRYINAVNDTDFPLDASAISAIMGTQAGSSKVRRISEVLSCSSNRCIKRELL